MGRSVSYGSGAVEVCFRDVSDFTGEWDWDSFIEWIRETAFELWPTVEDADHWLDREDHVVAENEHCFIGFSEYCGLASIWLVPRDDRDYPALADHWCRQIAPKFQKVFGDLVRVGTFSNGESVYERKAV